MGYPDGLNFPALERAIGENLEADRLLAESLTKGRKALAALDNILSVARDTAEALERAPGCEEAAVWWRCLIDELCNARLEADRLAKEAAEKAAAEKAAADAKLAQERKEAAEREAKAKAEADAIALRGDALRKNPEVLQLEAIGKWNGTLPQYMTSGASTPFIQVK